jgi:pimeloyl-ACP methyl ester carboxylesterase
MKRARAIIVSFAIVGLLLAVTFIFVTMKGERETALDKKIHIEKELTLDIPSVSPWCDELKLKRGYVDIGDCSLYVEEEGKGVSIVLLHGGPGSTHNDFHPHFSRAKDFARVIYYDQRGCALSDYEPGEGGYSVKQAVNDLEKLRKALGIEGWTVLGHSYGGYLAQRYAMKYPESVKGLILVTAQPGLWDTVGIEGVVHKLEPTRQYDYLSAEELERMKEVWEELSNLVKEGEIPPEKAVEILLYNNQLNGDWKRQNFYRPTEEEMTRSALYGWKHDGVFNEIFR